MASVEKISNPNHAHLFETPRAPVRNTDRATYARKVLNFRAHIVRSTQQRVLPILVLTGRDGRSKICDKRERVI